MKESKAGRRGEALGAAALAAIACALCACIAVTSGCGRPAEDVVREGVAEGFEQLKRHEGPEYAAAVEALEAEADLASLGLTAEEFCDAWLDGFDYEIRGVRVDGPGAVVDAVLAVRSVDDAFRSFEEGIAERAADGGLADEGVGGLLLEALRSAPLKEVEVEMPYVLAEGEWAPGPGFESELARAFAS